MLTQNIVLSLNASIYDLSAEFFCFFRVKMDIRHNHQILEEKTNAFGRLPKK